MNMNYTDDELVAMFLQKDDEHFKTHALFVSDQSCFYLWKNGVYEPLNDKEVMRMLWEFLSQLKADRLLDTRFNITHKRVNGLLEALKLEHKNRCEHSFSPFLTFNDGKVIGMNTFFVMEADPQIYSFFKIDAPSNVASEKPHCPKFEKFLREVLVYKDGKTPDEELIVFMQELFGYCLTSSIAAHAAFFFQGAGRNGKSVLLNVLRLLIGNQYISNMTMQTLTTDKFASSNLIGKKINIASEEESKFMRSDVFKGMVAGDPLTVERKYCNPTEMIPAVKFLFATNQLPVFDSTDVAIQERVFIIPFNRYFSESERNTNLINELKEEIGGIFGWALEGAKKIVAQGYKFSVPESMKEAKRVFAKEQSSVMTFFADNYTVTGNIDDDFVIKAEIYKKYKDWCSENKRQPKSDVNFFKDLKNVFRDAVDLDARRAIDKKETRVMAGIKKTDDQSAFVNNPIQYQSTGYDG